MRAVECCWSFYTGQVRLQLLPSTFESDGSPSARQHLTTLVVDDSVAFDAGSLAMAATPAQRSGIRDIVVSHAHLDHIAGLPLFLDDLFSGLTEPVRVHAAASVIEVLENHVFNWSVYPRFSELSNEFGPVMEYVEFSPRRKFKVRHLSVLPIEVNHLVPSCGFVISDGKSVVASTGDTAPTEVFWEQVNKLDDVTAVIVECAFPDAMAELAATSHHLTPNALRTELQKLDRSDCAIFISNIKPAYREQTVSEIAKLDIERANLLDVGRVYEF